MSECAAIRELTSAHRFLTEPNRTHTVTGRVTGKTVRVVTCVSVWLLSDATGMVRYQSERANGARDRVHDLRLQRRVGVRAVQRRGAHALRTRHDGAAQLNL